MRTVVIAALMWGACADEMALDVPEAQTELSALAVYQVAPDETLASIADALGVDGGWPALAKLNELEDANLVYAGQGLIVPRTDRTAALPAYDPLVEFGLPIYACDATYASTAAYASEIDRAPTRAIEDCDHALCIDVVDDAAVCKCGDWQQRDYISVVVDGETAQRWRSPSFFGDLRELEVTIADLDDDGDDELVVANLVGFSNGMVVSSWHLAILEDPRADPILFEVNDYGIGSLTQSPEGGCDVLATDWQWGLDPLSDDGTFVTARRYRYGDGALHPVRHSGIHARRLLYSFGRETAQRADGLCLSDVASWFSDPRSQWRASEPALAQTRVRSRNGVIREVRVHETDWDADLELEVELDDYTVVTFMRTAWLPDYPMNEEAFGGFVDSQTQLAYPESYRPAALDELVDAPVGIATYADDWGNQEQYVFLP